MTEDEQRQMRIIADDLADKALLEIHATRAILREVAKKLQGVVEKLESHISEQKEAPE